MATYSEGSNCVRLVPLSERRAGRRRPTTTEREALIVAHMPLVRIIASRLVRQFSGRAELDELVSAGYVGLIEAVDRFDPDRGVPFGAFAEIRIRGAMVDSLRSADWVPRAVRQRNALLERTRARLRDRLGRDPDRAEMVTALKLSPTAYDEMVTGAVVNRPVALDAPASVHDARSAAEVLAADEANAVDRWLERERDDDMGHAITRLPPTERDVIVLYFQQGLKYTQICERLNVCESRVSQLRGQAVSRMQKQLRGWMAS